jgi:hypothetical protein
MKSYNLLVLTMAIIMTSCLFEVQGQFQGQYVAPSSGSPTVNPSISHNPSKPIAVGGDYGMSWLGTNGNKNVVPNSSGLWDWGSVPMGNMLVNGKLVSTGDWGETNQLIYPAFPTNTTPIFQNRSLMTSSDSRLSAADFSSPYLSADPWTASQLLGQPIFYQNMH